MGMALVMPTREPKIRFPRTAASLHRALQNPKPVPLWRDRESGTEGVRSRKRRKLVNVHAQISAYTGLNNNISK